MCALRSPVRPLNKKKEKEEKKEEDRKDQKAKTGRYVLWVPIDIPRTG
jgi:hypothetical protein